MFLTIIVFILILGLLIFVHELGHFITAKRSGVKVDEFGFGFPPRIFGIKKGGTIYSLNLLPLGGFVRIYGENGPDPACNASHSEAGEEMAFYNKPVSARAKILVAGVTMNLVLAAVLLGFGHWSGLPSIIEDNVNNQSAIVQIVQVDFDSAANEAGINIGDTIKELKYKDIILIPNQVIQVQDFIKNNLNQEIIITIKRGKSIIEKNLILKDSLGVGLARTAIISYPWYQALIKGITSAVNMTWFIIVSLCSILWRLITAGEMAVEFSGPVGIFNLAGQATQLGFIYILQFTAILSINLAIINIIPFPALDGGRLLFLAIEKIKGSPVSRKIEGMIHTIGFACLIILLIAITWRDIVRLF